MEFVEVFVEGDKKVTNVGLIILYMLSQNISISRVSVQGKELKKIESMNESFLNRSNPFDAGFTGLKESTRVVFPA